MWNESVKVVMLKVKMWDYGPENRTSDIPSWSRIMFGFAQNEWNNLYVP